VLDHLLQMLDVSLLEEDIRVVAMMDKKNLIETCGDSTSNLLAEGCDRVVIVWDLHPSYSVKGEDYCLHNERVEIFKTLKKAGIINPNRVFLVCLDKTLESWLLADERALNAVLMPRKRFSLPKNPEREPDPKGRLITLFTRVRGHRYQDTVDAIKIVRALPDLRQLRKLETFKRFAFKALGRVL
jgi:hypothetical protein